MRASGARRSLVHSWTSVQISRNCRAWRKADCCHAPVASRIISVILRADHGEISVLRQRIHVDLAARSRASDQQGSRIFSFFPWNEVLLRQVLLQHRKTETSTISNDLAFFRGSIRSMIAMMKVEPCERSPTNRVTLDPLSFSLAFLLYLSRLCLRLLLLISNSLSRPVLITRSNY